MEAPHTNKVDNDIQSGKENGTEASIALRALRKRTVDANNGTKARRTDAMATPQQQLLGGVVVDQHNDVDRQITSTTTTTTTTNNNEEVDVHDFIIHDGNYSNNDDGAIHSSDSQTVSEVVSDIVNGPYSYKNARSQNEAADSDDGSEESSEKGPMADQRMSDLAQTYRMQHAQAAMHSGQPHTMLQEEIVQNVDEDEAYPSAEESSAESSDYRPSRDRSVRRRSRGAKRAQGSAPATPGTNSVVIDDGAEPHFDGNRFVCQSGDCRRDFNSRRGWRYHYQSFHLGVRYYCSWTGCDKSYAKPEVLKAHVKVAHTGGGFCCPVAPCEYKTIARSALNRHTRLVHKREVYICNRKGCQKVFLTQSARHAHVEAAVC